MQPIVQAYRDAFIEVIGQPDRESDLPVPWFARNSWDRVQWAPYVGDCFGPGALAFGINVEFLPTWRKIRPRLQISALEECLRPLGKDEWHWEGRPGFLCRNPEVVPLYQHQPLSQIDLTRWLHNLDEILDGRRTWRDGRPMRPQLQVMRRIGPARLGASADEIRHAMRRAAADMQPLMDLLRNRRSQWQ